MHLATFHDLTHEQPPFATVTLDVSRVDRASEDDVERRWRPLAEQLTEQGAPADLVDEIGDRATAQTGRGGEWTRVVVAAGDRLREVLLPGRPRRDEASWGPVPLLMPVVRALAPLVRHAVVRIDRIGADIDVVGGVSQADPVAGSHEVVEGDHDVIHKVGAGGWSQRRLEMRAEDSWERNAETVAGALDRLVRAEHMPVILVMGDDRAVALLERYASRGVTERLVRLDTGGRAAGTSRTAEEEAIAEALAAHRAAQEASLVDRFQEQLARQQDAVDGLAEVLEVLRRGQAEEILLVDGAGSGAAEDSFVAAVDPETGQPLPPDQEGGSSASQVPADAAVVWAAVASRAGVTLVDPHQVQLRDGVGALLRWSDQTTPHSSAPAMPGHGQ